MATYTYKCADCSNTFDVQATIQEKEEGKGSKFICPKCRSENIRQEFSVTNFIRNVFKGDAKTGGCCSGKNVCDVGCKPDKENVKKESGCCNPKSGGGSCCG
jgi:putative FmdB family regulatory protein